MPEKPTNIVLITDAGFRVPVDMRMVPTEFWCDVAGHSSCTWWEPLVEGDLTKIMPHVVKMEGDALPHNAHIVIDSGPGYDTQEWGHRLMINSPILFGYHFDA